MKQHVNFSWKIMPQLDLRYCFLQQIRHFVSRLLTKELISLHNQEVTIPFIEMNRS